MATFLKWNTDDPKAPDAVVPNSGTLTIGPINTGVASKIAGSVFSDTAGTCSIQQSFDYWLPGNDVNPSPHWDIVQYPVGATAGAVTANTPYTIDCNVLAPVLQVVFVNSNNAQTHLRIFVRVFGVNRG